MAERRFTKDDRAAIADEVYHEFKRRKDARKDFEHVWNEVDRQIAMRPDRQHKLDRSGNLDASKAWMPEMELPLQAQTHEVLTADARRMLFPASGSWFEAHSAVTDEYLGRVELKGLITGDENDLPSLLTQDNVDKLVQGAISYWQRQYDFPQHIDQINAEAFKYGLGVGKAVMTTKEVLAHSPRGVARKRTKYPALVPRSIRNTYPDDAPSVLMTQGFHLSGMTIEARKVRFADLKKATQSGEGWIKEGLKGIEPDKTGHVEILEAEGDFVVQRKASEPLVLPKSIVEVCVSGAPRLIRIRFSEMEDPSYIFFPYHREGFSAYPTSPLIKGWPIQKSAVDALNRMLMAAALNVEPPIGYDRADGYFAANGGPMVYPGAQWGTIGDIKDYKIGDAGAMTNMYVLLLQQYADVTGVNAPRLGAQTVSHTTAFAKEAELNRGVVRTVDYVQSTLQGPLIQWLDLQYRMGRKSLRNATFYVQSYGGFVTVSKDDLPEDVIFEAHGAGGPAEEQAKRQNKLGAIQMAIQIDQLAQAAGQQSGLDLPAIIETVLRDGGWTDVDAFFRTAGLAGGAEQQPEMAGDPEINPTSPGAALQALAAGAG